MKIEIFGKNLFYLSTIFLLHILVVEEKRSVLQKLKTELDRQYTLTQELGQKKKKYENEVEDLKDSADKLRKGLIP